MRSVRAIATNNAKQAEVLSACRYGDGMCLLASDKYRLDLYGQWSYQP